MPFMTTQELLSQRRFTQADISRFGMYTPPTAGQRASVIADRIETHNSAPTWQPEDQVEMAL